MDEVKLSPFRFVEFYVVESTIRRDVDFEGSELNLKYGISPSGLIDTKNKHFTLRLDIEIRDADDKLNISVFSVGMFEFKDVEKIEHLDTYFYTNAPAIIFPYVRAYIASLTALSGYDTINLPPVNIGNLMQELKDNTEEVPLPDSDK